MIGKQITPILNEIDETLWEWELGKRGQPLYDESALRSSSKILMSVLMDKMWQLQEVEKMDMETRCAMAQQAGNEFREFIKKYTNIDTHSLYK